MFIQDSLTEEHMTSLALLIKDMDRECAKLGKGQGNHDILLEIHWLANNLYNISDSR